MKRSAILATAIVAFACLAIPAKALVAIPSRPPGPAPSGWVYRYISPIYQTITDRVWVAERVEYIADWVEVRPGRWEQVYRRVVTPGHFDYTTRQVLVSAGRWELVRIDPPVVIYPPRPRPVILSPGTVGVEGYSSGTGEDLSKFSPLTEWPK